MYALKMPDLNRIENILANVMNQKANEAFWEKKKMKFAIKECLPRSGEGKLIFGVAF
jgi:hypothetical protein